jgi:hypothetical protein
LTRAALISLFRMSSESPSVWKPDLPTLTFLRAMPELSSFGSFRCACQRSQTEQEKTSSTVFGTFAAVTAMTVCGSTVRSWSSQRMYPPGRTYVTVGMNRFVWEMCWFGTNTVPPIVWTTFAAPAWPAAVSATALAASATSAAVDFFMDSSSGVGRPDAARTVR